MTAFSLARLPFLLTTGAAAEVGFLGVPAVCGRPLMEGVRRLPLGEAMRVRPVDVDFLASDIAAAATPGELPIPEEVLRRGTTRACLRGWGGTTSRIRVEGTDESAIGSVFGQCRPEGL